MSDAGEPRITVVGLGPGDPALLTGGASQKLAEAPAVYLRTTRHPTVQALTLGERQHSFDHLYNTLETVDEVYERIAAVLVQTALDVPLREIIYAVPGSPATGEHSVMLLRERASEAGVALSILPGISALEAAYVELGIDPIGYGLQTVDAPELAQLLERRPSVVSQFLNPTLPMLITGIWQHGLAAAVKGFLLASYPPEWLVQLVRAGLGELPIQVALEDLDRGARVDHLTTLYVPPLPLDEPGAHFYQLTHIVARLRGPGGCPWDREQTHESIKRNMLEEAYEAVEALDTEDLRAFEEELGDVLMQVSLQCEIAHSDSDFDIGDVVRGLSAKLVRRHPHIFGDLTAHTATEVLANWARIKTEERTDRGESRPSALDGVPTALPALARAQMISSRAAKTGFDWRDTAEVWRKVREEIQEVEEAHPEDRLEELGDLVFVLVNWARFQTLEAEEALRRATLKFERRFRELEQRVRGRGKNIHELSSEELDEIWNDVKGTNAPAHH
ncbi:MAG: nucleoside triphosphate pyrophosphohydrolase [Chloroflexota bacterium]|nr:nucleoside triphosphate pyrophosphohydrolase [Chloroflexota bacterium]